ncbi:hypothetical protein [Eupransor demetentiae]|uniref:Uncharacterized protein n=1 Tax=Eupransor demetentiae TaxID=3109584 RepID=A0ABM9N435_9LACO|nr:hypothetical protein R54876_GBNLAHCA_00482 [Lactobacillaceae bacterium LMG 33000]
MIKKVKDLKSKKQIVCLTSDDFPVLKRLKNKRNHVHLQGGVDIDTDYKSFNIDDLKLMKRVLFNLFGKIIDEKNGESEMSNTPSLFDFLQDADPE